MLRFFSEFYNSIQRSLARLTPVEQLLVVLSGIIVVAFLFSTFFQWSHRSTVLWPQAGGSLHEGALGTPRFIHPLYAKTNTERDLVALTFSGLMRETEDGVFVPDLAQSYTRSEDNTTYTFTLREGLTFHDGKTLDADDVVFTYNQAQTLTESPNLMSQWQGITISKIDTQTVELKLDQPFADFLDQTTLGIVPQHIWEGLSNELVFSQFMIQPIGSGPFMIHRVESNKEGFPTSFQLKRFKDFALGAPYLRRITYSIFQDSIELYKAFETRKITSFVDDHTDTAISKHSDASTTMKLNRLFGLFVSNKSTSPLQDPEVLRALEYFIDKDALLTQSMSGYGTPRTGVLDMSFQDLETDGFSPEKGYAALSTLGWTLNEETGMLVSSSENTSNQLSFSLATSNAPHLIAIAEYIEQSLREYGIEVILDIYTSDALLEDIIPKRSFDVLLFGMSVPFPGSISSYWHSSQRNDPGRNITQYTNASTDKILESAHTQHDTLERTELYYDFDQAIAADRPAIILYAPDIVYEAPSSLTTYTPEVVDTPRERFNMVHTWFVNGTRVWSVFEK